MKNKIIQLIKRNRISTTEVADALGKSGVVKNVHSINSGMHKVGEVQFFYAYNKSNWELHEQIEKAETGKIAFFEAIDCEDHALFGELVSKYLLLYKQIEAIVINGYVRDAHTIQKENFPVWMTGKTPIGCFNKKNKKAIDKVLLNSFKSKYEGGIMVCDDCGVVLIEPHEINETLYDKLKFIEFQEDIWFFCLDRHKMSTYEIVCQKKYLSPNGLIDNESLDKLSQFSSKIDRGNEK